MTWVRAFLVLLVCVSTGLAGDELKCIADDATGHVLTAAGPLKPEVVHPGLRMGGSRAIWTVGASRVRLVFPGWSLILGPDTKLQLGGKAAPIVLARGSVRVENRPGDTAGPSVAIATRLIEVHTPADGRALLSVIQGTGKVPDTIRVIALRGNATLAPFRGTVARQLLEGHEVTGAGWIPVSRWTVRELTAVQRQELETRSLMKAERAQLPGKAPLIPFESLRLDGSPVLRGKTMYLSAGDVPPEGQLTASGVVRLDRLPPALGEVYAAASMDGGETWERLKWIDDHGGFQHRFSVQDGETYQLRFGVFQVLGGKLYESTDVFPLVYRTAFEPSISGFKVCETPLPADGSLIIYSDELVDYSMLFEGTVRCDAPLSRIRVEVSPDAGVRWRPATILAAPGEPSAGTFRVAFTPVPGANYRFRVRTGYAKPDEAILRHQTLSDWDSPGSVKYRDMRSTERIASLVHELETALRSGDQAKTRALLAPQFNLRGRDPKRALTVKFRSGATAREAGTLQVAVDWERNDPDGQLAAGKAIFLYVKQADYALVEILGEDPLAASPAGGDEAGAETVQLALGTTFDIDARRTKPYDESAIPDDVAFYRDDQDIAVLGTHDRRLAPLPDTSLDAVQAVPDRMRLEYRAEVVPTEGSVLYLKSRQGGEYLLQILEAGAPDSRAPRVKLAFRALGGR